MMTLEAGPCGFKYCRRTDDDRACHCCSIIADCLGLENVPASELADQVRFKDAARIDSDNPVYRNQNEIELGLRTVGGALPFSSTPDAC
jgi:hypothetical protein